MLTLLRHGALLKAFLILPGVRVLLPLEANWRLLEAKPAILAPELYRCSWSWPLKALKDYGMNGSQKVLWLEYRLASFLQLGLCLGGGS